MIIGILLTELIKPKVCFEEKCYIDDIFRWLMFAAKMGVSASFSVIWIYSAELFPTVVRTNALR